jgi:hypothetical protein
MFDFSFSYLLKGQRSRASQLFRAVFDQGELEFASGSTFTALPCHPRVRGNDKADPF